MLNLLSLKLPTVLCVANIVMEGLSCYSFDAKVSVWVDIERFLFAPLPETVYELDGKVTLKEDHFFVEAILVRPCSSLEDLTPGFLSLQRF